MKGYIRGFLVYVLDQEVVKGLGDNGVMVILDNHVSKPRWCCSDDDGNGFFGDSYFDPDQYGHPFQQKTSIRVALDPVLILRAQKVLSVKSRNSTCLQAEGERKETKLGNECSVWEIISDSMLHLSSKINNNASDVDANNNIVTNACKCLSGVKMCDPASQWFKLVDNTRNST
ncbi:hypothetical protein JHK84_032503 [Glycine max]|nr:hypothetical protein JHK85_032931 [Glycine max]KAG5146960.1 hypothetical protein JHK84_032503 [Glycine max]